MRQYPPHLAPVSQKHLIIAIVVPSGVLILAVALLLTWLLRKRWKEHKRAMEVLTEQDLIVMPVREGILSAASHPGSTQRRNLFPPYASTQGWGTLLSHEDLGESPLVDHARNCNAFVSYPLPTRKKAKTQHTSPKRKRSLGAKSIPLKKFKVVSRLSAIVESPRSQSAKTPSPALVSKDMEPPPETHPAFCRQPKASNLNTPPIDTLSACPGSPAPDAVPSSAKKPKPLIAQVGVIDMDEKSVQSKCVGRSISTPIIFRSSPNDTLSENSSDRKHLQVHSRPRSFCGQLPSQVPRFPVPPLPQVHTVQKGMARSRSHYERSPSWHSMSSAESGCSSILGNSPAWKLRRMSKDCSWGSNLAHVKEGANRDLSRSIVRPEAQRQTSLMGEHWRLGRGPIHSNTAELDLESYTGNCLSRASSCSSLGGINLPFAQLKATDKTGIGRMSFRSSDHSAGSRPKSKIQNVRHSRSRVTLDGSPEERRDPALGNTSSDSLVFSRCVSDTSERSLRSTENAIHWEISGSSGKPSALKGSPGARKGNRRSNNVRISSLAPTVLGQENEVRMSSQISRSSEKPSKTTSFFQDDLLPGLGLPTMDKSIDVPVVSSSIASQKIQPKPLRTFLTSTSPTLLWTNHHHAESCIEKGDQELDCKPGEPSFSLNIPNFPIPTKDKKWATTMRLESPTRTPYCQTLSAKSIASSSPSARKSGKTLPESPLVPSYQFATADPDAPYDPAWPHLHISPNQLTGNSLDDLRSPSFSCPLPDISPSPQETIPTPRSSPTPNHQMSSHDNSSMLTHAPASSPSPPISPKSRPVSSNISFGNPFNSAPLHFQAPLDDAEPQRRQSESLALFPLGPSQEHHLQSPTTQLPILGALRAIPLGPRAQPPVPIRKSVEALRRMNSEAAGVDEDGEKRWRRLGREASPVLPGLGFLDGSADISCPSPAISEGGTWAGDLTMEDIPGPTPSRKMGKGVDHDDYDDYDEIDMAALEEEIVSGLEEAEALEREEAEARERLGLRLELDAYGTPSAQRGLSRSSTRQPLGGIPQGRSPAMSCVPEESPSTFLSAQHTKLPNNPTALTPAPKPKLTKGEQDRARDEDLDPDPEQEQQDNGRASANVWEDGERFWEETVNQARRSLALEMERRAQERESRLESERWEERARKGLGIAMINGQEGSAVGEKIWGRWGAGNGNGESSIQGTPRSLYDRDGFLR